MSLMRAPQKEEILVKNQWRHSLALELSLLYFYRVSQKRHTTPVGQAHKKKAPGTLPKQKHSNKCKKTHTHKHMLYTAGFPTTP